MTTVLETEFYRMCNLISEEELRRNPRAKKKMIQMRQTLSALVRLFNLRNKIRATTPSKQTNLGKK